MGTEVTPPEDVAYNEASSCRGVLTRCASYENERGSAGCRRKGLWGGRGVGEGRGGVGRCGVEGVFFFCFIFLFFFFFFVFFLF